jgi:pimeloyl-ACP methyl ester carboxylesterase
MRGISKRTASAGFARRRAIGRLLAATLFTLAAMLAWSADHSSASARSVPCSRVSRVDTSLRQNVVATRVGPIGYYRYGQGQPLLLVTGYRATISEWNGAFLDALAIHHEVIVMDNPGVGRSRSDHVPDTMGGMANAVSEFIDAMHLGKVDVLGWSMGGMVAQQLALAHPQQVRALVLMSTTPPGRQATPVSATVNTVLSGQAPSPFEAIMGVLFPPDARIQAIQCFRSEMFMPSDYGRASVDARVAEAQSRAMTVWWKDDDAASALERLATPTLVVVGDKDDVLAPENAQALARLVPHAMLYVLPGGGHALMYQHPQRVAGEITRFLDEQPQPNAPHRSL